MVLSTEGKSINREPEGDGRELIWLMTGFFEVNSVIFLLFDPFVDFFMPINLN